jgi:tetratricopeptide (TPR) repeat protein
MEILAQFERLKEEANTLFRNHDYIKAYDLYTKALSLNNNAEQLAVIYCNRSNASIKLNKLNEALNDINKAIYYRPIWAKAIYRKALILSYLKEYDQSLFYLTQAEALSSGIEKEDIIRYKLQVINLKNQEIIRQIAETESEFKNENEFLRRQGVLPSHDRSFILLGLFYGIPEGSLSFEKVQKWLKFADRYGLGEGRDILSLLVQCVEEVKERDRNLSIQFISKYYTDRYI